MRVHRSPRILLDAIKLLSCLREGLKNRFHTKIASLITFDPLMNLHELYILSEITFYFIITWFYILYYELCNKTFNMYTRNRSISVNKHYQF